MNKLHALAIICALGGSGCIPFWLFDDDDDDAPTAAPFEPIPSQPTDTTPPDILTVGVAEWPPIGAYDLVPITVRDDIGLAQLKVQLGGAQTFVTQIFGRDTTTQLRGEEIGEGYGTLTVTVVDQAGLSASKEVENVLVDLSPPEITPGNAVIRADAELEIWVADAWVLGRVELLVDGAYLTHDFPQTYPGTLGIEWDYAMVSFAGADLPLGSSLAVVTAYDAAGNSIEQLLTLVVDGEAPTVQITAPGEGATVTGLFDVTIDAQDDLSGAPQLALTLDSVPAAMVSGPSATVQLDASALATGTHTLEAIATDGAGNVSTPAVVHIDVP